LSCLPCAINHGFYACLDFRGLRGRYGPTGFTGIVNSHKFYEALEGGLEFDRALRALIAEMLREIGKMNKSLLNIESL